MIAVAAFLVGGLLGGLYMWFVIGWLSRRYFRQLDRQLKMTDRKS